MGQKLESLCVSLIPPPRILETFWLRPFFPTSNLKNWFSPFLPEIFQQFLCANSKTYGLLYRYYCKNTLYYQLSMLCTVTLQRGLFVAAGKLFKKLILMSKCPNLCPFLSLSSTWKVGFSHFLSENLIPFGVAYPNYFPCHSLFEIFKNWVPIIWKGNTLWYTKLWF